MFKLTKADSFEQYRGHLLLALLWKSGNTAKSGGNGTAIVLPVLAACFGGKKKEN
ncbi:hypothetical protein JWG39_01150 [Desulforhopalus vacuolatus]|uniref:hypothetical protein n=1 Tax=Desulforhopalus vacuolatus TaxID=40414 RepID=UPI001964C078|nr:hypothetical protein [Desulforhopalus vacuolatus]MBM9518419.1 hypothetical protein [Desulforhopalus vacuolatus]